MRVLVTGAAGFAGSHVVQAFKEHGAEVISFDLGDRFPPAGVDVVVSLAATAEPRDALNDPAGAYANNTRIMIDTLEYARRAGARVLHVSTNEAHPPRGPYGGAKACQEIVCDTYADVPITVVVTQSLFGERQQPNKLIPTAIRSILKGSPMPLQCSGVNGDRRWAQRPFLHAWNLADALLWLTEHETPRRVHVGATETVSVHRLVTELAAAIDCEAIIKPVAAGDRAGHELGVDSIGCDVPGWQPTYDIETALRDVARWYVWHPESLMPR